MAATIFITGTGTGIGKTVVAAIVTEALQADYWKPVQAGFADGTDTKWVRERVTNTYTKFHPELYSLKLPASPHIAARAEGITIQLDKIIAAIPKTANTLVIEGAGGLLVPLNDREFVADLATAMGAKIILVSRNYLGSINHSLLTAEVCRSRGLAVAGWIFNDHFGNYEAEIAGWTGLPVLGSIPFDKNCDRSFIHKEALKLAPKIRELL
jgi:dethiobiotin synthetase